MAGTENRWTSTSSTDWGTGGNWSRAAPPVDDDDVVVGIDVADILGGFPNDAAAPAVNSFHRHKNSTSTIGSSGTPMRLATVTATSPINSLDPTGKVIVQGSGDFFYINGVGGAAQTTDKMYIDTAAHDTAVEVDGAISRFHLLKGRVVGLANFQAASIAVGFRINPNTDAHLTLQGSLIIAGVSQSAGTIINTGSATITDLGISGGTFDHGTNAGILNDLRQTAGLLIHRAATDTALAFLQGGICDYSQDPREKAITFLQVFPGAAFLPNAHITISQGGSIFPLTPIIPEVV